MSEENNGNIPEADRYSVEHVDTAANFDAALQEKLNEGSRQSWRLISVVQNPTAEGVLLVWDLEGFISG